MIGVAAEIGEQEIKLFVKRSAGAALEPRELSDWLAERLAPYQNPRYIVMVDEFERTASQRIMKHKLATLGRRRRGTGRRRGRGAPDCGGNPITPTENHQCRSASRYGPH